MKKLTSLILALVMILALSVPAFATPNVTNANASTGVETAITGVTQAPDIKITIPTTAGVVVNPYQIEVKVKNGAIDSAGDATNKQIISAVSYIKNQSNVAVNVSVTVTGKVEGAAKFATASAKDSLKNEAYVYFQLMESTDDNNEPTWAAFDADKDIVLKAGAVKKANMIQMAADADGSTPTYAAFHLAGDAATAPTVGWTDADKISATVAFTFAPYIPTT